MLVSAPAPVVPLVSVAEVRLLTQALQMPLSVDPLVVLLLLLLMMMMMLVCCWSVCLLSRPKPILQMTVLNVNPGLRQVITKPAKNKTYIDLQILYIKEQH